MTTETKTTDAIDNIRFVLTTGKKDAEDLGIASSAKNFDGALKSLHQIEMSIPEKTTDFDTAIIGTTPEANRAQRAEAMTAIRRIEASHSALFAALETLLDDPDQRKQAEAAIALAKGGSK